MLGMLPFKMIMIVSNAVLSQCVCLSHSWDEIHRWQGEMYIPVANDLNVGNDAIKWALNFCHSWWDWNGRRFPGRQGARDGNKAQRYHLLYSICEATLTSLINVAPLFINFVTLTLFIPGHSLIREATFIDFQVFFPTAIFFELWLWKVIILVHMNSNSKHWIAVFWIFFK